MPDQAMYQRAFRHLPALRTPRLLLRKVQRGDARAMFEYARDPDVSRYVLWDAHRSVMDTQECIRELRTQYRRGWPCSFAIVLPETDRMIGTIGFMWLNPENRSAEIGYSLGKAFWNQGYMTEALTEVLRFAFETLKLHRVEAQHDIRNPASGRVMEKAGMAKEGVLRDRLYNKGRYCTVAVYARINPSDESGEKNVHV